MFGFFPRQDPQSSNNKAVLQSWSLFKFSWVKKKCHWGDTNSVRVGKKKSRRNRNSQNSFKEEMRSKRWLVDLSKLNHSLWLDRKFGNCYSLNNLLGFFRKFKQDSKLYQAPQLANRLWFRSSFAYLYISFIETML